MFFFQAPTSVLLQNNVNTPNAFNRSWVDFQNGFGDSFGNYWLGNDAIHAYQTTHVPQLYVYVFPTTGGVYLAIYQYTFVVYSGSGFYGLSATKSGGNATTDGMKNAISLFSTYDQDHDKDSAHNCAAKYGFGGWFGGDTLNGSYVCGSTMSNGFSNNFVWGTATSSMTLKASQMWMV